MMKKDNFARNNFIIEADLKEISLMGMAMKKLMHTNSKDNSKIH